MYRNNNFMQTTMTFTRMNIKVINSNYLRDDNICTPHEDLFFIFSPIDPLDSGGLFYDKYLLYENL